MHVFQSRLQQRESESGCNIVQIVKEYLLLLQNSNANLDFYSNFTGV